MSNISANSGGNLSFVQFLRNQSRRLTCLAPSALSSGILCEILVTEPPDPSLEGRAACTLSASSTRSCNLCTALTSFNPGRSLSNTAAENRPSSVSVSWWAFSDDVTCINAETKSGCQSIIEGITMIATQAWLLRTNFIIIDRIMNIARISMFEGSYWFKYSHNIIFYY